MDLFEHGSVTQSCGKNTRRFSTLLNALLYVKIFLHGLAQRKKIRGLKYMILNPRAAKPKITV